MTVDDDNSIYVGGLPYTSTEDSLHRVFAPYGPIIAVKIINDNTTRGKCYGFVTYRNPRSVIDAINDMDGKTIDGRVVRVNEVTTRGGRSNFGRERFRRNLDRGMDLSRGRDQVRDYDRDRDRYREQYSDRSRERARSWGHIEDVERQYDLVQNDRARNDSLDEDQSQGRRNLVDNDREEGNNGDWNRERDSDLHKGQDWEMDGTNGDHRIIHKETDQQARKHNDFGFNDQESREQSSDSSGDHCVPVKEKLERSVRRRNELNKEISEMEKKLADKEKVVLNLQKKSQMLEDAFITAKKRSSQHKMQLTKLQKCFLQVNEYSERLKSCEVELQLLVNSAIIDSDLADEMGTRDGVLMNGKA
ncbi:RNA-binding (RRM/RBD/RNP motifs) family protein [Euphorbia peplus]|nr:RNA-binding (RRM/RBD/RNP motifs) family protein [Euphorbia peplus]